MGLHHIGLQSLGVGCLVVASLIGVPREVLAQDEVNSEHAGSSRTVFQSGQDGYHTYRIPALIVSAKGSLLAFCEGRKSSRADHGDLDLLLRRSTDGGRTWLPQQLVYEEGGEQPVTIGNPCPVVDQASGRIWLPFCRNNDDVLVTHSDDEGVSWSRPREITADVKRPGWTWYATGPGVGIQVQQGRYQGRMIIPCDHREPHDGRTAKFSHVFYSDDGGETWQLGGTVAADTDECQVVELPGDRLMMNMRNYLGRDGGKPELGGMRTVSFSDDGGTSWSTPQGDSTLIEPVCQASLIRYAPEQGNPWLIFSNPASSTTRHRLTVRISRDLGASWPIKKLLHEGPAAYSCLAILPDGQLGCLYEAGKQHAYETIRFQSMPFEFTANRR